MSSVKRVLAIGGHAADMEFSAGAAIAKYTASRSARRPAAPDSRRDGSSATIR